MSEPRDSNGTPRNPAGTPGPARERKLMVPANELSVGCSIQGEGKPLVLIHGAEADRTMFASLSAELASSFTVIAYDQRDSGLTVDPRDPPRSYDLADLADDVTALIDALGYRCAHVFGTSLGGHIAQVLAAGHPDRVDRLVLASTWRAGLGLKAINPDTAAQLAAWRADSARHVRDIASKFFPQAELESHPQRLDMFRGSGRTPEQAARRAGLLGKPYPIDPGQIGHPTLLLMGALDALVPNAETEAIAPCLRDVRSHVMPGVGHVAAIQSPVEVARVVSAFLEH